MGMQIPILFAPKLFEGCAIIINVDFTIAESVNYIYNFALYAWMYNNIFCKAQHTFLSCF